LDLDGRLSGEKENKRRHHSVPTEHGFALDHISPLSNHDGEHGERGLLLLLNATILVITAMLMGIAMALSFGNPVKLFGDKASLADNSALVPRPVQSTPAIQSTADARASTPPARGGRDEIAAGLDTKDRNPQAGSSEPSSGALLKQFQAWADRQDARADGEPERSIQDARAQDLQDAQAPAPPIQKHHRVRAVRNARARSQVRD
jgi:hypothetical protein